MGSIKDLDSTALYAYTTLVSVVICVPAALIVEGRALSAGLDKALAKNPNFYWALLSVGLLYHLYNQVCAFKAWTPADAGGQQRLCAAGISAPPCAAVCRVDHAE